MLAFKQGVCVFDDCTTMQKHCPQSDVIIIYKFRRRQSPARIPAPSLTFVVVSRKIQRIRSAHFFCPSAGFRRPNLINGAGTYVAFGQAATLTEKEDGARHYWQQHHGRWFCRRGEVCIWVHADRRTSVSARLTGSRPARVGRLCQFSLPLHTNDAKAAARRDDT
jgi:hypothetical protein